MSASTTWKYQLINVSVNKPFKHGIYEEWANWMLNDCLAKSLTKVSNMKHPTLQDLVDWIRKSWENLDPQIIFKIVEKVILFNQILVQLSKVTKNLWKKVLRLVTKSSMKMNISQTNKQVRVNTTTIQRYYIVYTIQHRNNCVLLHSKEFPKLIESLSFLIKLPAKNHYSNELQKKI